MGETTSFDLHPSYVEATRKSVAAQVSLGEELGQINGFVAGRPFPRGAQCGVIPRAGEKLAWNYKYGYNWGDSAAIYAVLLALPRPGFRQGGAHAESSASTS